MEVRRMTGEDAKEYYELRLEALLNNPEAFITTYHQERQKPNPIESTRERLNHEKNRTFGFYVDGTLQGVLTVIRETHPKFRHKAMIVGMYVAPGARRSGAGKQLIQAAIDLAGREDIEILQLSVVTSNTPAKKLYESMGFQEYGFEKHAIKLENTYLDETHMALYL